MNSTSFGIRSFYLFEKIHFLLKELKAFEIFNIIFLTFPHKLLEKIESFWISKDITETSIFNIAPLNSDKADTFESLLLRSRF